MNPTTPPPPANSDPCPSPARWLEWLDGAGDLADREAPGSHIDGCPACILVLRALYGEPEGHPRSTEVDADLMAVLVEVARQAGSSRTGFGEETAEEVRFGSSTAT